MVIKPKLNKPDVETTTTFNINEFKQNLEDLKYNINLIRDKSEDFIIDTSGLLNNALDEMNNAYYYFDGLPLQSNPTLSECIKEWEERGYLCFLSKEQKLLDISNLEEYSVIKIGLENKHYIKVDSVLYSSFVPITFEEHNLINKTLKALEVEE